MSAGPDRAPSVERPIAIHATAVAIGGLGLVIRGPSRAGKSTLALALIAASTPALPVTLIGDDRVILSHSGEGVHVAPHPRIAGLIEKRGAGILAMPHAETAPVGGVVDLPAASTVSRDIEGDIALLRRCDLMGANFPSLFFVNERTWDARRAVVLKWFGAASAAHSREKTVPGLARDAKD